MYTLRLIANSITWIILAASLASAQQPRSVQNFKSSAELVLVPAYVTVNRQPIRGLKAGDFQLLHDGTRQAIDFFEEIEVANDSPPPASSTPQVAHNFQYSERHQQPVILLLDFLHMSGLGWGRLHRDLPKLAQALVDQNESVQVLVLSWGGLLELAPPETDSRDLLRAAELWSAMKNAQVSTGASRIRRKAGPEGLAEMLRIYGVTMDHAPPDVIDSNTQRFESRSMTSAAIEEISQAYRGAPGRKKLIWIASDLPTYIKRANGKRLYESSEYGLSYVAGDLLPAEMIALKALMDANIAVYPIIMNQLIAQGGGFDKCGDAISPQFWMIYTTGGSVCDDAPHQCVERVVADAKHYYMLAFYLRGENRPEWHKVKATVSIPKADVRAKQAFIVGPGSGLNGIFDTESEFLRAALESPLDYTALPLSLRWKFETGSESGMLDLAVAAPAGSIVADGNPPAVALKIAVSVVPDAGGEPQVFEDEVTRTLSEDDAKKLQTAGFSYKKRIQLPPAEYHVRVLVRDNLTNRVGTVRAHVNLAIAQ